MLTPIVNKVIETRQLIIPVRKHREGDTFFGVPKKRLLFRGEDAQRSVELFEQSEKTISGASC